MDPLNYKFNRTQKKRVNQYILLQQITISLGLRQDKDEFVLNTQEFECR